MNELIKRLESLKSNIVNLKSHLNLPQKAQRLLELEDAMQSAGFWQDNLKAQKVSQEYNQLKKFYDFWLKLEEDTEETLELVKASSPLPNPPPSPYAEASKDRQGEGIGKPLDIIEVSGSSAVTSTHLMPIRVTTLSDDSEFLRKQVDELEKKYKKNRFVALLSKQYDDHNAIFSIHSGAGGVDAQDWASMLLRMFLRYAEKQGFSTEILELAKGEQGGVKTAVVEVKGPFAYGLFKSEAGVHRLVRLSPFNPAHTRETSFALLELLPILEDKEELKIDEKDLKIEANTASGHGGQSVNTTYSAIRITHIPTGIKVSIQNERSQHQNRQVAMKILMAKLKALEEERLQKEKQELRGEFKSAEWGNQIRSYVIHPYKLVKDHRTDFESTDPDSVLEGELTEFVEKYLEQVVSCKL